MGNSLLCVAVASSTTPSTTFNEFPYFPSSAIFISLIPRFSSPIFLLFSFIHMQVYVFICIFVQYLPYPFYVGLKGVFGSQWQSLFPELQNCDFYGICCSFLKLFPIIIHTVWFRVFFCFRFFPNHFALNCFNLWENSPFEEPSISTLELTTPSGLP